MMELLIKLRNGECGIKELSRSTGIPERKVRRMLLELEREGKVESRKAGRMKVYALSRRRLKFSRRRAEEIASKLNYSKGLIAAVARDWITGEILMLAYMNREAVIETLTTGYATYFSRTRGKLWRKGEESGNLQLVKNVLVDCDEDSLILDVEQIGVACHTGKRSCFYREISSLASRSRSEAGQDTSPSP